MIPNIVLHAQRIAACRTTMDVKPSEWVPIYVGNGEQHQARSSRDAANSRTFDMDLGNINVRPNEKVKNTHFHFRTVGHLKQS